MKSWINILPEVLGTHICMCPMFGPAAQSSVRQGEAQLGEIKATVANRILPGQIA